MQAVSGNWLPSSGIAFYYRSTGKRAVSSVVEHYLDTVGVTGSNPVSRTRFKGGESTSPVHRFESYELILDAD